MVTITREDALILLRLARCSLPLSVGKDGRQAVIRLSDSILNEKDELAEAREILRKVNLAIENGGRIGRL